MSYYDILMAIVNRPLSVVGRLSSVSNFLYPTFPPKLLGGLSPIFTGMIPGAVPFQSCTRNFIPYRILVAVATKRKSLKNLLVKSCMQWSDFKIIWYRWSLGDPLPKLFKLFLLVKKTWLPGEVASFSYVNIQCQ